MPIIERIKQIEEIREIILNVPDKSGRYSTAFGDMEIILGPVISKKGQVNMRKLILRGGLIGDKRLVAQLHPSPRIQAIVSLNEFEFLSIRSVKKKKGRERL